MTERMVVQSLAGRDKGKLLVVLAATDRTALVADGKERPLQKPKQKNRRHLAPTRHRLSAEQLTTDRMLRTALRSIDALTQKEENDLGKR